jgi:prepilin signal peptidase PulO-like enzyme (type II secretory pathway)
MVDMSDISSIAAPIVLGLLIGSSLNVVIHRLTCMVYGQSKDLAIKGMEAPPLR